MSLSINPKFISGLIATDQELLGEAQARQGADALLQSQITSIISNTDPAALDSLSELVSAFEAADSTLNGAITALGTSATSALGLETSARESADIIIRGEFALADANLQSQVNTEKGRVDAILLASDADKDSFAEIVQLINSVDVGNDSAFAGYVTSNNTALASEASARANADAILESDLDDLDGYAQDIRSDVDDLDGYAQDIRSDLDLEMSRVATVEQGFDSRLDALEAQVDGPAFANSSVIVGEELVFIDLDRQYSKLMSVCIGRLMIHEGEDFTVSVVGGKTRLTWINYLAVGGAQAIQTGDKVFFVGAY